MAKKTFSEQLEKLTPVHKVLILVLALGIIVGGGWYFLLAPKMKKVDQVQKEIRKLKKEIKANKKIAAELSQRKENLQAKKQEFVYAKQLLPQDAQALERLLASFEKLGNDKGVEFLSFRPGGETKSDFYAQRSVQLKLEGNFYNLMRYFDSLSRLDRLVELESVRFSPKGGKDKKQVVLSSDVSLLVYRSLTPKELEDKNKKKKK